MPAHFEKEGVPPATPPVLPTAPALRQADPVPVVAPAPSIRADRRVWTDINRERLLEEGHPDAAFLVAAEGSEILPDVAKSLDLEVSGGKVKQRGAKAVEAEAASGKKAVAKKVAAKPTAARKAAAKKAPRKRGG